MACCGGAGGGTAFLEIPKASSDFTRGFGVSISLTGDPDQEFISCGGLGLSSSALSGV